ncbi:hypothetical protein G7Y89_g15276 [Cudoniella acicularis]|uniref:Uncharacterized protein n=1 Tax=Cudoniella acicularis TaxID=354080 RepID=A0A8H4VPJ0_9HELO|nr:hypothetical protein G7Y89_g15276 [Cudoniella acicularis]
MSPDHTYDPAAIIATMEAAIAIEKKEGSLFGIINAWPHLILAPATTFDTPITVPGNPAMVMYPMLAGIYTVGNEGPDRVVYSYTSGATSATFIGLYIETGASAAGKLKTCTAARAVASSPVLSATSTILASASSTLPVAASSTDPAASSTLPVETSSTLPAAASSSFPAAATSSAPTLSNATVTPVAASSSSFPSAASSTLSSAPTTTSSNPEVTGGV